MQNKSSNLTKQFLTIAAHFAVAIVLMTPLAVQAQDMKTKFFFRDLQRCAKFVGVQHKELKTIFTSLTAEEVQQINDSIRGSQRVQLFNSKVDAAVKKLGNYGYWLPKGVKFGDNQSGGIPRNLLAKYSTHIGDYYEVIILTYKIPAKDHAVALERYANYLIDLLDKIQELRSLQEDIGLTITSFPKINGNAIPTSTPCPTFFGKHPAGDISVTFKSHVFDSWKRSTKKWMDLYSNPNILTVQKLWLENILTKDLGVSKFNENFEEAYMAELDFIDKRLAAVSSAPTVSADSPNNAKTDKGNSASHTAPKKGSFKLDLPE